MIEGTNLHIVQEPRLQVHIVTPAGSERRRRRQTVEVIKSPVRNLNIEKLSSFRGKMYCHYIGWCIGKCPLYRGVLYHYYLQLSLT